MKELCVIGNSQMAALKEGYDSLEKKPFRASFWGIPGGSGPAISIVNGRVLAQKQKKRDVITDICELSEHGLDLSRYDAVLLSGVGLPARRKDFIRLIDKYLIAGFIDDYSLSDKQILSKSLYRELLTMQLSRTESFLNIEKIRGCFRGDIYIQTFPLPTDDFMQQSDHDLHCYGRNIGNLFSWLHSQMNIFLDENITGENINRLKYPQEWVETGFTPSQYASTTDAWHMNTKFGLFVLRELAARLTH